MVLVIVLGSSCLVVGLLSGLSCRVGSFEVVSVLLWVVNIIVMLFVLSWWVVNISVLCDVLLSYWVLLMR